MSIDKIPRVELLYARLQATVIYDFAIKEEIVEIIDFAIMPNDEHE